MNRINLIEKKKKKRINWFSMFKKLTILLSVLEVVSGIGIHVLLWIALIKYIFG